MFGQSLLSAFGIACTTDTDQLFTTDQSVTSTATYQLNNATTSIPSNTYPGTASNITYAVGKFDNAAVFNGSNSLITIANNAVFNFTTPTSMSVWVNRSTTNREFIIDKGNGSSGSYGWQFEFNVNEYVFQLNNTAGGIMDVRASASGTGSWEHVVVTFDSNQVGKIYLNGVLKATDTLSGTASFNTNGVTIGTYSLAPSGYRFNGKLDQIRFFNSSLPQSAVTVLYNETTTTAQSASIDYVAANPNSIAYYKMSDATDQLGNYNGTATNVNFNTEGKFGFAGAFNGSNADIDLPANIESSTMAVSLWAYLDDNAPTNQVIIEFENGYGLNFPSFASGKLAAQWANSNANHTLSNVALSNGQWYHIAANFRSGATDLYINGVQQTTGGTASDYLTADQNTIGSRRSGEFFDGKIDQIRIYDSALSAADVTTLYKEVECEPAAINALDHFNTITYDGTGGSQSTNSLSNQAGTLGFAPGMTWIKSRSNATWHEVHDVVRGNLPRIFPNDSYQELTSANGFASFDSNGFSLDAAGSGGDVNTSGRTYVAWNWKAALANLSTEFNSNRQGQITLPSSITTPWNTSNEFGVSCWINPSTWGSSQQTMAFYFNGANSGNIGFDREPGGNFRCFVTTSGGSFIGVNSSNNLSATNKWYHIVFTGSAAAGVKLYVDGVNTGSASWDGTYVNSTGTNSIGVSPQSLRGNIAQFRVYSSYLTTSEVSDLYTEPAASNNTLNYPAGAGCIAAYPLQTDAVDLSGNYSGASSNVTFGHPGYLTSNTDGTIPSTVAANTEAGFSIVQWTGTRPTAGTLGHGLGLTPEMIIIKNTSIVSDWTVYAESEGPTTHGILDTTGAWVSNAGAFNNTSPTSNVFTVGGDAYTNGGGNSIIAYCFTSIPGYSKIGSYLGTGSSTNTLYTGFEPTFLLVKNTSGANSWVIFDNKRSTSNPRDEALFPNLSDAEYSYPNSGVNFNSTGFSLTQSTGEVNGSGNTYIFLAIA